MNVWQNMEPPPPGSRLPVVQVLDGGEGLEDLVPDDGCGPLDARQNLLRGLLQLGRHDEVAVRGGLGLVVEGGRGRAALLGPQLLLLHDVLHQGLDALVADDSVVHLLALPPDPLLAVLEVILPEVVVEVPEVARPVLGLLPLHELRVERQVVPDAVLPLLVRGRVVRVELTAKKYCINNDDLYFLYLSKYLFERCLNALAWCLVHLLN